jgi:hypothetical protein
MSLTITGKVLGSRRPLFADFSVPLPPDDFGGGGGITLRDLISLIATVEVGAYERRREERRLDRVFTAGRIERELESGRVSPEGRESLPAPSEDDAIAAALLAFEDGLYIVAIDGQEHRDLDAQVFLHADSRVTFIRLVFLAGA